MKKYMENKIIFKNKTSLAVKLFIMVWVVLLVHVLLKVTFNYWQPYVIPNETLQHISDYIDNHRWLQATLNGMFYVFNGIIMTLCSIKRWWFKSKKQAIFAVSLIAIGFVYKILTNDTIINTLLLCIVLPIILDYKKLLYTILTFAFTNLFLVLSLFLEGFVNSDNMNYIVATFLQIDFYIMLILNYFAFNLIRKRESNNG